MKPIDLRDANYERLRGQLEGLRREVYEAWMRYGPCTTRELAERCGVDLLTVRPRTTELMTAGLVEMAGAVGGEGRYCAVRAGDWERWRQAQLDSQMRLL